ncbi:MAG: glycosyl hydrolase [Candidatus Hydrogenedentota bacterium]
MMKVIAFARFGSIVALAVVLTAVAKDAGAPLFDGETFAGWEGNLDFFRVEDGAIVGGSMEDAIPRNEFLCTKREYGDFELTLKFKLVGEKANAGVQFRTTRIPDHHEVSGYQADMGEGYWGCLYDESRRNKVLAGPDEATLKKALKPGEWNEYVIRCEGPRIQLWLNGVQTVDYTEEDDAIARTGIIGLQIHSGPPSEAWYKDVRIKELK